MTMEFTRPRASSIWITLGRMIGGGLLGAAMCWLYFTYARELRWSDIVALGIALMCMIGAVRLFGDSFNRRQLGKMMSVEGEASDQEAQQVRLQALIMGVLGVSLFWPPLATLNGAPAPAWTYAVVVASLIANVWFTWRVYQRGDEYARQRMLDVTFRASLAGQALLIAYAGAERLGLVAPATAWEVLVAITAVSIVAPLFGGSAKAKI